MKTIMVMFDTLNRHMLPPYGCDWTVAPNFKRLAERTVTFDRSYVCSMPCMPARRDLHTGRPNFLHRSWGPLEPFDDSVPSLLSNAGVHTHLSTDHYHYWEDGGATYHNRYSSYDFIRGQEGDTWKGQVRPIPPEPNAVGRNALSDPWTGQDRINRSFMPREEDHSQTRTFNAGLDFLDRNHTEDNWFLQIETFDPHEPFFSHQKFKDLYHEEHYRDYQGPQFDWPCYGFVEESKSEVAHLRHEYASLLSMCDHSLGRVLDRMDQHGMWEDTLLIVWTDHGFMLGEKDCYAKMWQPFYEEIAHTPFFVWDPRCSKAGERRQALVQPSIDLGPTLLEFFGQPLTSDMRGRPLRDTIAHDEPVREAGIFGLHGGHVNVTDGRYVYMRAPATDENAPLYDYTLMPTRMRHPFGPQEFTEDRCSLTSPLAFTKGAQVMKIQADQPRNDGTHPDRWRNLLWDIEVDPGQQSPIDDPDQEARMTTLLKTCMEEMDAPPEQYQRLGLRKI